MGPRRLQSASFDPDKADKRIKTLKKPQVCIIHFSLDNGYVEGSFITFLEPVGALSDQKSVVRNLVAPRIL